MAWQEQAGIADLDDDANGVMQRIERWV